MLRVRPCPLDEEMTYRMTNMTHCTFCGFYYYNLQTCGFSRQMSAVNMCSAVHCTTHPALGTVGCVSEFFLVIIQGLRGHRGLFRGISTVGSITWPSEVTGWQHECPPRLLGTGWKCMACTATTLSVLTTIGELFSVGRYCVRWPYVVPAGGYTKAPVS